MWRISNAVRLQVYSHEQEATGRISRPRQKKAQKEHFNLCFSSQPRKALLRFRCYARVAETISKRPYHIHNPPHQVPLFFPVSEPPSRDGKRNREDAWPSTAPRRLHQMGRDGEEMKKRDVRVGTHRPRLRIAALHRVGLSPAGPVQGYLHSDAIQTARSVQSNHRSVTMEGRTGEEQRRDKTKWTERAWKGFCQEGVHQMR